MARAGCDRFEPIGDAASAGERVAAGAI